MLSHAVLLPLVCSASLIAQELVLTNAQVYTGTAQSGTAPWSSAMAGLPRAAPQHLRVARRSICMAPL